MFTVCDVPRLWFQVIDCVLPVTQVTAVFGAVTVIESPLVTFVVKLDTVELALFPAASAEVTR